jgi:hypothetical protein
MGGRFHNGIAATVMATRSILGVKSKCPTQGAVSESARHHVELLGEIWRCCHLFGKAAGSDVKKPFTQHYPLFSREVLTLPPTDI